ncbi:MAG: matrixin family metalloprotease [Rhodospirillaceae bacterium]
MKGWLLGLALAGLVGISGLHAQTYLGFRLLDFDGIYVRWGGSGPGPATVTYAFAGSEVHFDDARNCSGMVPVDDLLAASGIAKEAFEKEVEAAFGMWEQVANIRFERAAPGSKPGILIGAQSEPIGHAYADVAYAKDKGDGSVRQIERSLICLNPAKRWKVGFDGNLEVYDIRYTLAHEIGHAIGLDHPEPHGQLMSMRYQESFRTLQAGDVSGVVRIYGARATR